MGEMMGVSVGGRWPPKDCSYEYTPINAQWVSGTYSGDAELRFSAKHAYIRGSLVEFWYFDGYRTSDAIFTIDAATGIINGDRYWYNGNGEKCGTRIETTKREGNTFTLQVTRYEGNRTSLWTMVVRFDREVSCKYIDNSYKEN